MERESKRKLAPAASPNEDSRAPKRPRLAESDKYATTTETPQSAAEEGLKFVETLKQARDKTGRLIATNFLTLPDKRQYRQYYQTIQLPIAIDTVEAKLNRKEYPNLSAVEADVKRMINNAKSFNEKTSEIYSDAERIRKMLSNYMSKNNPAYRDPNYVSFPTPIPGEIPGEERRRSASAAVNRDSGPTGTSLKLRVSGGTPARLVKRQQSENGVSSTAQDLAADPKPYIGKTFQEAQDQIITELIKYKDEDGLEIFFPFVNLPPRTLNDYYALIKHLVCLKSVQKRIRGIHGRNPPTGISDFKSWDTFEEEVSYIWRNAREYNEDGSDIYKLAGQLEGEFRRRLQGAKSVVDEPPQPTLKLKMTAAKPAIKLRLGQKGSPAPPQANGQERHSPGMTVDSAALQRQRDLVNAGIKGQSTYPINNHTSSGNAFGGPQVTSGATPLNSYRIPTSEVRSGPAQSPPMAPAPVKSETYPGQSPALSTMRLHSSGSDAQQPYRDGSGRSPNLSAAAAAVMPPPSVTPRPPSVSPHPSQQVSMPGQYHTPYYQAPPPSDVFQNKFRLRGQNVSEALIQSLSLNTHPGLQIPPKTHFQLTIPAHETFSQQSVTINLPQSHYYLQLRPHLHPSLLAGSGNTNPSQQRQYRIFVTANGQRIHAKLVPPPPAPSAPIAPMGAASSTSPPSASSVNGSVIGKEEAQNAQKGPLYEVRLVTPGLNRIEVEILAAAEVGRAKAAAAAATANGTAGGAGMKGASADVEFEKITVFANLLRS